MDWGFIWLMFVLKVPIIGLLWIVWWAAKDAPAPDDGGESRQDPRGERLPRHPGPPAPRRGPHGEPAVPPPPRTRTTTARARVSPD